MQVWAVDLVLYKCLPPDVMVGEAWTNPASWMQLFGFSLLLAGTIIYAQAGGLWPPLVIIYPEALFSGLESRCVAGHLDMCWEISTRRDWEAQILTTLMQGSSPAAYRRKEAPDQAPAAAGSTAPGGPDIGAAAAAAEGGEPDQAPPRPLARRQSIANIRPLYSIYIPSDHRNAPDLDLGREGDAWQDLLHSSSVPSAAAAAGGVPRASELESAAPMARSDIVVTTLDWLLRQLRDY